MHHGCDKRRLLPLDARITIKYIYVINKCYTAAEIIHRETERIDSRAGLGIYRCNCAEPEKGELASRALSLSSRTVACFDELKEIS